MKKVHILFYALFIVLDVFIFLYVINNKNRLLPEYKPKQIKEESADMTFDEFVALKQNRSRHKSVRPGCDEMLIRFTGGRSDVALLYIHGFGASRGEGEYGTRMIAESLKANCYFMRLPGHGTSPEDHRDTALADYLDEASEALLMMNKLGKKTVVIGTSFGGLIAAYLASEYPDRVDGLVLVSPFFKFHDPVPEFFLKNPVLFDLVVKIKPKRKIKESDAFKGSAWRDHWYEIQYLEALKVLYNAKKIILTEKRLNKVTMPVCLLYYYKDQDHFDTTASISAMKNRYEQFGGGRPHLLNRIIAVKNGNHVMLSEYSKTDRKTPVRHAETFIRELIATFK